MSERNRITLHAHCRSCMPNQSPSEWSRLDAGLTPEGIQVWCKRCKKEVAHFTPAELETFMATARCHCCPDGRHLS